MGRLDNFNLGDYDCNVYVETGTGECITLSKAVSKFKKCFSVDLDKELYELAKQRYPDVNLINGRSTDALETWLSSGDILESDRVLFFLDAHFPGSDFRGVPYDVSAPDAVPLQKELEIIKKYRPNGKDYIICDDLRIYCQGPFGDGNVPHLQVPGGLSFLEELVDMKNVTLDYRETGYIFINKLK